MLRTFLGENAFHCGEEFQEGAQSFRWRKVRWMISKDDASESQTVGNDEPNKTTLTWNP